MVSKMPLQAILDPRIWLFSGSCVLNWDFPFEPRFPPSPQLADLPALAVLAPEKVVGLRKIEFHLFAFQLRVAWETGRRCRPAEWFP